MVYQAANPVTNAQMLHAMSYYYLATIAVLTIYFLALVAIILVRKGK